MKFSISYYLLLLYLTVLFKPLMPVVCDVWSHEFNGLEHIFNVHAKYGTNHVEKELAESSANDNSNKSQKILKSQDTVAFHIPQQSISYVFAAAAT
ncbi:MAG TPA: hypothetical protein VF623_13730, partial [Segetibacter sp.]